MSLAEAFNEDFVNIVHDTIDTNAIPFVKGDPDTLSFVPTGADKVTGFFSFRALKIAETVIYMVYTFNQSNM